VEEEKRQILSIPKTGRDHEKLRRWLINDLTEISKIVGEFRFEPKALQAYAYWYEQQEKDAMNGRFPIEDTRFRGYCERRATHVKKISMLISAARGGIREISLQDFDDARYMLARAEPKMPRAFGGLGESPNARAVHDIMQYIAKMKKVTRSHILNNFYTTVGSSSALDVIEGTLVDMKRIRTVVDSKSRDTLYIATTPEEEKRRLAEEENATNRNEAKN